MAEYPKDVVVLYSQGHSLARFLAGRSAPGVPGLENLPFVGQMFKNPGGGRAPAADRVRPTGHGEEHGRVVGQGGQDGVRVRFGKRAQRTSG